LITETGACGPWIGPSIPFRTLLRTPMGPVRTAAAAASALAYRRFLHHLCGAFYYLCSTLDGFGRFLVHWDLRESMREADVEVILQRAKEKYPEAKPRIISDNGPQFIARDFKEFIRISGVTHVRTSPYYPQSNGKIERWHKSLKSECIRPGTPLSLEDARRLVDGYVEDYNNVRLNSATGYITSKDVLAGRQQEIHAERDRKLEAARQQRPSRRQQAA
jgi:putative transposase